MLIPLSLQHLPLSTGTNPCLPGRLVAGETNLGRHVARDKDKMDGTCSCFLEQTPTKNPDAPVTKGELEALQLVGIMIKIARGDDVASVMTWEEFEDLGPVQQARPSTFQEAVELALMVEKENNRQLEEGGDNKRKRENRDDDMKKIKISGGKPGHATKDSKKPIGFV
ncbi:hypothetical protein Tco_0628370 [Tanacetum coccineum]|uniref:Uncharacterized protein n=1 Tax=Tanacetum coccineum TaxID=301880 RepID=A0ABQ4WQA6_9ASTR